MPKGPNWFGEEDNEADTVAWLFIFLIAAALIAVTWS